MCGFYCVALMEYMRAEKALFYYTNLFSPNDYKKDEKILYRYFKDKYGRYKSRYKVDTNWWNKK